MSGKLLLTPQNIQNTYTLTQKFCFKDISKGLLRDLFRIAVYSILWDGRNTGNERFQN